MFPYLVEIGSFRLPTYGVLVAIAVGLAWTLFGREARRLGLDGEKASSVLFWTIVAGILGGKLGLVLVDLPAYLAAPRQLFNLDLLQSAGVVWAAVLAGLVTAVALTLRARLPLGRMLDAMGLPVPIAQAIGRLGCMAAGCCFGGRCALPWAVTYHSREAHARTEVPLGVPLHPTPLYEAAWSLLIVLPVLLWVRDHKKRDGEVMAAYLATYGVGRFLVEFTRGDAARGLWFGGTVSTSQLISLAMLPLGAGAWFWLRRRRGPEPA